MFGDWGQGAQLAYRTFGMGGILSLIGRPMFELWSDERCIPALDGGFHSN